MRIVCLLLLLFLASGCAEERAAVETLSLQGEVVASGAYLGRPSSISVAGDQLIVTDATSPYLHVLSAATGAYQLSFGKEGAGPGEFREATDVFPDAAGDGSFWVFDGALSRLSRFAAPAGESPPRLIRTVNLSPGGPTLLMHAVWLSDSAIAATGIYPDGRIAVTDPRGRIVRYIGNRPANPLGEEVPITVLQHAFTGPLTVSPDRRNLAMGTQHADQLEIYRPDGTLVRAVRGAGGFDPVFEVHRKPAGNTMATGNDLRFGYTGLASTDTRIYGLYSGQLRGEAGGYGFFGTEVHVFTWTGDRVATFTLEERTRSIAVTPEATHLYAVQWTPEPRVVRYRLPI